MNREARGLEVKNSSLTKNQRQRVVNIANTHAADICVEISRKGRLHTPTLILGTIVKGYGWGPKNSKRNNLLVEGYYRRDRNEIGLYFDVEQDDITPYDLEVLNHEYLHWVLYRRIGKTACKRLDSWLNCFLEAYVNGSCDRQFYDIAVCKKCANTFWEEG